MALLSRQPVKAHQGHFASGGFTLLEVLVALAVLAIVMITLVRVGGQSAQLLDQIEGDYYADIIAQDLINRAVLERTPVELGRREQTERINHTDWRITRTVEATQEAALLMVTFRVVALDPYHGQAERQIWVEREP